MKILLCLLSILLFCLIANPLHAEESIVKGTVGKTEKLLPLTNKYLDEAIRISDECSISPYFSARFECNCVGIKFLELRRKQGDKASAFWLREDAQKKCPNEPGVAGMIYSQCLPWASVERPNDYKPFCRCYGSNYARIFAKNPSNNQLVVESQMIAALGKCDVNRPNEEQHNQELFVQRLKENGSYDRLFPGAAQPR